MCPRPFDTSSTSLCVRFREITTRVNRTYYLYYSTCVNGQISPMISVQMLTLFLMFITSGIESSHFRET